VFGIDFIPMFSIVAFLMFTVVSTATVVALVMGGGFGVYVLTYGTDAFIMGGCVDGLEINPHHTHLWQNATYVHLYVRVAFYFLHSFIKSVIICWNT
jgi:hypothetical protein